MNVEEKITVALVEVQRDHELIVSNLTKARHGGVHARLAHIETAERLLENALAKVRIARAAAGPKVQGAVSISATRAAS